MGWVEENEAVGMSCRIWVGGWVGGWLLTGMRPRFFSQKMEQKEPEKKMPSTAANAIRRSAKEAYLLRS